MKENALLLTVRWKRFTPEEYNRMRKNSEEVPENLSLSEDLFNRDNNEKPKQSLGGLSPVQFQEHNPKGTYLMVIKDWQKSEYLQLYKLVTVLKQKKHFCLSNGCSKIKKCH